MEQEQQEAESKIELTAKELVVMANLVLSMEYPHSSMTLEEIAQKLRVSKVAAAIIMKGLVKKGCVTRVKSFISFYYPVADHGLRREVLRMMGLIGTVSPY